MASLSLKYYTSRTNSDQVDVVGAASPLATMISVQDQHLFYGSTNWHLTRPVDINNCN